MKTGTVLLLILVVAGVLLWRNRQYIRAAYAARRATRAAGAPTPAAGAPAPAAGAARPAMSPWWKNAIFIGITVVILALVYWGHDWFGDSPDLTVINSKIRAHWLKIIIAAALLSGLIAFNATSIGGTAKTLQKILWSTLAGILLFGLIPTKWLDSQGSASTASTGTSAPAMSGVVTSPPHGDSERVVVVRGFHPVFIGPGGYDMHVVYGDGRDIATLRYDPQGVVGIYLHNNESIQKKHRYEMVPNQ